MKVKALITAAGMGKRFGAITQKIHKGLLEINGKPLIFDIIEKLKTYPFSEIMVVTGYQSDKVKKVLPSDIKTIFNPFYAVSGILGSFWAAKPLLENHPFLFTTCDHFFHKSVLTSCLTKESALSICVEKKKSYTAEDAKVLIKNGEVIQLGKEIPVHQADGEFGGMAYFSQTTSQKFFKELEIYFEKGKVTGYVMDIMNALKEKYSIPISVALCSENSRIDVDYVKDLRDARNKIKGKHNEIQI